MKNLEKLRRSARLARELTASLTDPKDVAELNRFAEEVEELIHQRERLRTNGPRIFWPHPGFGKATLPMLSTALKQVFEVEPSDSFDSLLARLDSC